MFFLLHFFSYFSLRDTFFQLVFSGMDIHALIDVKWGSQAPWITYEIHKFIEQSKQGLENHSWFEIWLAKYRHHFFQVLILKFATLIGLIRLFLFGHREWFVIGQFSSFSRFPYYVSVSIFCILYVLTLIHIATKNIASFNEFGGKRGRIEQTGERGVNERHICV